MKTVYSTTYGSTVQRETLRRTAAALCCVLGHSPTKVCSNRVLRVRARQKQLFIGASSSHRTYIESAN